MSGARVELAFQRPHERGEEIEKQTIGSHNYVAQFVLHERAEDDGLDALILHRAIDPADRLLRLVNARHKWQSDRTEFQSFELRHEAVAQRFRRHASLVRNEEDGSTTHGKPSPQHSPV